MINRRQAFRQREEFARVLDFIRSGIPRRSWRREPIPFAQCVGEEFFTLLEVAIARGVDLDVGSRIYVGSGPKKEVASILGRIDYEVLSQVAKDNLSDIVEGVVLSNEEKYVRIINSLGLLTPKLHAFELLSGIGRNTTRKIIEEREKAPFKSMDDFYQRTRIANPEKVIVARIIEEISSAQKYKLFVR